MSDGKVKLPVWNDKYDKIGVTPDELYLRQQGLCWLKPITHADGTVELYCTDGVDIAMTRRMLNPTFECAKCMATFAEKVIEDATKKE
jgi:hypothetical protein